MTARARLFAALCCSLAAAAGPSAPAGAAEPGPSAGEAGMQLLVEGDHTLGERNLAVRGQLLQLRGVVAQFVPGQVVTVRVEVGGRAVLTTTRPVDPAGSGGEFTVTFRVARAGELKATVTGNGNPLAAESAPVTVYTAAVRRGYRGLKARFLQHLLRRVGYAAPRSGRYDDATARAVLAYRKVNRLGWNGYVNRTVMVRLADGRGRFPVYFPHHGRHAEVDLGRQVLALINADGSIFRVYHASSGKGSTPTVRGSFRVQWKSPGTNKLGMVHSSYFHGGYAIHGYKSVPLYPASHGCVRIPIRNSWFVSSWLRPGTPVDVYYRRRR